MDQSTAIATSLIQQRQNTIYIGVDSETVNPAEGRMSVRLESKATYNYGLIILDLLHMPASTCGTWQAFWTVISFYYTIITALLMIRFSLDKIGQIMARLT